ncbi:Conserved_hypothetical protein [Hexamita inflata]|uniref:Uncharacterized protein n=1 Tax=Hexamita inflata TaxID=28002 RepID=A0AA86RWJ8_9EUKA|nr:Conserved hypothetical protein [Hexamita inflata]
MTNNIKSDGIETLKNCELPLSSFSFIGFFGSVGTGKTTQLQNIADTIVDWSKSTSYDLDKPTLCNGPVTHYIFMSPSTHSDNTLQHGDKQTLIEATDENIIRMMDSIRFMGDQFNNVLEFQDFIRCIAKDIYKQTYKNKQELRTHPFYEHILLSLKLIKQFKTDYQELRFKETNQQINKVLYDISDGDFDGYLIRRPKVILIIDDQTGSKLFRDVGNDFYRALSQRRHLSLFFTGVSIHSSGAMQIGFKSIMNSCLLFRGLPIEKVKGIYGTIQALDSIDFNVNDFVKIYQNITGYNETDMDKKEDYKFNFLYIQSQPVTSIWLKFDKRLK